MNSTPPTSDESTSPPQKPLSVLLDEIEQRANAAKPGPWIHHHGWAEPCLDPDVSERHPHWCEITGEDGLSINGHFGVETSSFIAAARSNVPALVEIVRMALPFVPENIQLAMRERLTQLLTSPPEKT